MVPSVEGLGVDPVELSHPLGQIPFRGFDQEVVVIVHQAIGRTEPMKPLDHRAEDQNEVLSILLAQEDLLAGIAPGANVIYRSRIFDAQGPGHGLAYIREKVINQDLTPLFPSAWRTARRVVRSNDLFAPPAARQVMRVDQFGIRAAS